LEKESDSCADSAAFTTSTVFMVPRTQSLEIRCAGVRFSSRYVVYGSFSSRVSQPTPYQHELVGLFENDNVIVFEDLEKCAFARVPVRASDSDSKRLRLAEPTQGKRRIQLLDLGFLASEVEGPEEGAEM